MDYKRSDIPRELVESVRFIGTLAQSGVQHKHSPNGNRFECREWKYENGILELRDVITDTGVWIDGIRIEERWSHKFSSIWRRTGIQFHDSTANDRRKVAGTPGRNEEKGNEDIGNCDIQYRHDHFVWL